MPRNLTDAMMISKNKPTKDTHLTRDAIKLIQELIALEIDAEIFFCAIKKKFAKGRIDLREIFEAIDLDRNWFITCNEFIYLFNKFQIFVNYDDMTLLMDRLDKNKDGVISVSEFYEEFI